MAWRVGSGGTDAAVCLGIGEWLHGAVRFAIGWASGWSMVLVAAWTNERLAHYGRPALSAAVFAGPGAGIFISGMLAVAINSWGLSASQAWLVYGALALVLIAAISINLPRAGELHRPDVKPEPLVLTPALKRLVWSYSLAGFGYILPATFLSQMAAARFPESLFAQFVWPILAVRRCWGLSSGLQPVIGSPRRPAWRSRCGYRRWACFVPKWCRALPAWQ